MKKTGIIIVLNFMLVLLVGCDFTKTEKITYVSSQEIAKEKYQMQDIRHAGILFPGGLYAEDNSFRYTPNVIYGKIDGEDKILIVPPTTKEEPYFLEWMFAFTLEDVYTMLNSTDRGILVKERSPYGLELANTYEYFEKMEEIEKTKFDIKFYIVIDRKFLIGQKDNKMIIFNKDFILKQE